jgi:hypothetical protein
MSLDAILNQYKKNTAPSGSGKKSISWDERQKMYFTTHLADGLQSATKRVRVLPVGENQSPFIEIMGHKHQVGGQWRTFICPQHQKDEACPFCEVRQKLLSTGIDSDKELAKKYGARKMYVAKVIDRENEDHGPKFWRFNHDYRKTGILDKIVGVLNAIKDSEYNSIDDKDNGRDLIVNIARDQNNKPTVNSIVQSDPSPLSKDAELAESWLADDKTWETVYSVKPYEYLEIVVKGGEPTWKKNDNGEGGKWVDKASLDAETSGDNAEDELTIGGEDASNETQTTNDTPAVPAAASVSSDSSSEEDDDDLPF